MDGRVCARAVVCFMLMISGRAAAATVQVADESALRAAIQAATAGDEIVLAPGRYELDSSPTCAAAGSVSAPILVRSATPLAAKIEFDTVEGFRVTGSNWHFEGLDISGVCAADDDCEHAFHVTGAATGFVLRGNRISDFNAQLKVNADMADGAWRQPNAGLVEGNEVFDTHPRATSKPVTKLNIDSVDDWVVRANYIHDAHKNGGDFVSYQSFMKGGGRRGLYERNLVICAKDDTTGGTRIGLSFGGGGTGAQFCAPAFNSNTPCDPEMVGGSMLNNVIVNCSDVAIYLNKAVDTRVLYNTLVATSGIDFRFASSSGEADGNVLGGVIRTRDGASVTKKTNLEGVLSEQFNEWHVAPLAGDLRRKGDLASLLAKGAAREDLVVDYCLRARSDRYDLGALQASLGDCVTVPPPLTSIPNSGGATGQGGSSAGGAVSLGGARSAGGSRSTAEGGAVAEGGALSDAGAPAAEGGAGSDGGSSTRAGGGTATTGGRSASAGGATFGNGGSQSNANGGRGGAPSSNSAASQADSGCACSSTRTAQSQPAWWLVVAAAFLTRRRRA